MNLEMYENDLILLLIGSGFPTDTSINFLKPLFLFSSLISKNILSIKVTR